MPSRYTEVTNEFGQFLDGLAKWDVFATWTFSWHALPDSDVSGYSDWNQWRFGRRSVTTEGSAYWSRRILERFERAAALPIYAFWAIEHGSVGGKAHIHALIGNVAHLRTWCGEKKSCGTFGLDCCMTHMWPCGIARVLPFDRNRGATDYCSKYVAKQLAEWGLHGDFVSRQAVIR